MTKQANVGSAETAVRWAIGEVRDKARRLLDRLAGTIDRWARLRAATALYEELSKLPDAELERRGLPRAELCRWVFAELVDQPMPRRTGGQNRSAEQG